MGGNPSHGAYSGCTQVASPVGVRLVKVYAIRGGVCSNRPVYGCRLPPQSIGMQCVVPPLQPGPSQRPAHSLVRLRYIYGVKRGVGCVWSIVTTLPRPLPRNSSNVAAARVCALLLMPFFVWHRCKRRGGASCTLISLFREPLLRVHRTFVGHTARIASWTLTHLRCRIHHKTYT